MRRSASTTAWSRVRTISSCRSNRTCPCCHARCLSQRKYVPAKASNAPTATDPSVCTHWAKSESHAVAMPRIPTYGESTVRTRRLLASRSFAGKMYRVTCVSSRLDPSGGSEQIRSAELNPDGWPERRLSDRRRLVARAGVTLRGEDPSRRPSALRSLGLVAFAWVECKERHQRPLRCSAFATLFGDFRFVPVAPVGQQGFGIGLRTHEKFAAHLVQTTAATVVKIRPSTRPPRPAPTKR